jgi:hypothetical protein
MGRARVEAASSSVSEKRSPLSYPPLTAAPAKRHGLLSGIASEALMAPGQGLEPRPSRSERDVLPVKTIAPAKPARPPRRHRKRCLSDPGPMMKQMTRLAGAKRCFPSHSPTLRPWIVDRRVRSPSYVEGLWSPSLVRLSGKAHAKVHAPIPALFRALSAERSFSLRRGLDSS